MYKNIFYSINHWLTKQSFTCMDGALFLLCHYIFSSKFTDNDLLWKKYSHCTTLNSNSIAMSLTLDYKSISMDNKYDILVYESGKSNGFLHLLS